MSSAARTIERRRFLGSPQRTAAVLPHLALRGAAIAYLGLLVALPVAAVITKGFGDGLATFTHAMAVPGAWAAIKLTLVMATVVAGPSMVHDLTPAVLLAGVGLAILLPVVPFALEMLALRRLTATAFGTLMSLEPAVALVIGFVALGQRPGVLPVVGVLFVVAAGVGAERTGAREPAAPPVLT